VSAVVGEVDDSLAEPVVAAAAEHDGAGAPRGAGRGGDPGCGGERVLGGEPPAGVPDLSEQGRGAHRAGAGQAGEHLDVDVRGQRRGDVVLERGDALAQAGEQGDQLQGDGFGGVAGRAVGQPGRVLAADAS
jgi:hypothetical protein